MSRLDHFAIGFEGEQKDYEGEVGRRDHITRSQVGTLPTSAVAKMRGARGEVPGEHTTRSDERYAHLRDDIAKNGIKNPIFITVDHGEEPKLSEGNNRRDIAVELKHPRIPVEVRYFGKAEQGYPR